jgi:hypothetical protein
MRYLPDAPRPEDAQPVAEAFKMHSPDPEGSQPEA